MVVLPASALGGDVVDADAATKLTVTAPRNGALVTGKTVRVRVAGAGRGFEAIVGSRDVSKRFKPAPRRKGVRIAVLRRGRDFSSGANRLLVNDRGSADTASFIAGRRVRGTLKLRRLPGRTSRAAVHLRAKVSRDFSQVRLRLNGERVPKRLWPRGRRSFEALLGADEGARFGANRLVVTVIGAGGAYDRVVRRFRVAREAPLVGAGADRRTKAGRLVRLDGRATRSARGGRVGYRWSIVKRPRGSRAKLRHSHSARPLLRPDKRGTYEVRLAASGRDARDGATASSSAAPTAADQVSVQAAPAVGPMGLPVQTLASGGGIEIGGKTYTTTANWVQVLLLDRATLEVKANAGFDINEPSNFATALAVATTANRDQLVIVSGGGRGYAQGGKPVNGFNQENAKALSFVFALLGGDNSTGPLPEGGMALADGNWSIVGQAGVGAGAATQNHGMASGDGELGSLSGYLQQDRFGNFAFVEPENVSVDTSATGAAAGTNAIEVGSDRYQSQPIASGGGGFQVLVLDGALNPVANETFTTNETNGAANEAGVEAMSKFLRAQQGGAGLFPQNLVIVQSIGRPGAASAAWVNDQNPAANNAASWGETLAGAIGGLGGPAAHDQFAQIVAPPLDAGTPAATGGYTLIASTRLSDPFDDAYSQSQALSGLPSARVVGSLSRNRDSQWVIAGPSSTPEFETGALADLAFQAPTAFPLSSGAYLTASEWIAARLGFTAPDVRAAYYENAGGNWGDDLYRDLQGLSYEAGKGFSEGQYKELKAQLLSEFTMVDEVWKMIGDWQGTFGSAAFPAYVNLQSIASDILVAIKRQRGIENSPASFDPLSVFGSSLWMAQGIAGISGQEDLEPGLGIAASAADLLDSVASQGPDGGVATAPIETKAAELGSQLASRYAQISASLAQLGNLFVSDWGKLQQAARNSNGVWETNSKVAGAVQTTMTRAAQASFYTALLPLAYGQYVMQWQVTELNSRPWQHPWNYRCSGSRVSDEYTEPFTPTKGNPASWMVGARSIADDRGRHYTVGQVRLISTQIDWKNHTNGMVEHEPQVLPLSVSSTLFQPLSTETGLGLDQVRFFGNPAFQRWGIECEEFS